MVVADLHVHTTASDGTLALEEVPSVAQEAGLRAVAVTDHDRPHPGLDAPVVDADAVTIVHGIELRVDPPGLEPIDLLGYGLRPTPALRREVARIQRDRVIRARAIVECVEDHLGIDLASKIAFDHGVGRPHVARAIADHSDTNLGYAEAFDRLIGSDRPCYVARDIPSFERGVEVLRDACGLVGLAHPLRYTDPDAALELARGLDAVERHYPYAEPVDPAPVDRAIREADLVPTGGSDAHDRDLGRAGVSAGTLRRVLRACGG